MSRTMVYYVIVKDGEKRIDSFYSSQEETFTEVIKNNLERILSHLEGQKKITIYNRFKKDNDMIISTNLVQESYADNLSIRVHVPKIYEEEALEITKFLAQNKGAKKDFISKRDYVVIDGLYSSYSIGD